MNKTHIALKIFFYIYFCIKKDSLNIKQRFQGGGKVFYTIKSINTDAVVFEIEPLTGELKMLRPVSVEDTESGRYDIVVRATDQGK